PIAFFSAEFAIHNSLPIYAGGLGVLAGDICKEASDLGLPLVGVGFMYPQGYFHQHISASGWQEEIYLQLDFDDAPISPVYPAEGRGPLTRVQLAGRWVYLAVWQVRLGCVNLYLLDTNVEENAPQDRQLSARLYTADREQRIQQEIVLGIGGARVLRALNIQPAVWHANEGHTAFMMLERAREEVENGATFAEAVRKVRDTTVFTNHTPVPAGQDFFTAGLMDKYFHGYWDSLGTDRQTFLGLGQPPGLLGGRVRHVDTCP
ncbi:MAG: alpha-glucan family phosphorylase, partial [Chloroflexota bacterium]